MERLPSSQLTIIKSNFSSDRDGISENTLVFLNENALMLHPDDRAELITAALKNTKSIACRATIELIKGLPAELQSEPIKAALGSYDVQLGLQALDIIKGLPANLQPCLIQIALCHFQDEIRLAAFQFIKNQPAERQPDLIMAALNSGYAHAKSADGTSSAIAGLIRDLPLRLRSKLMEDALESESANVHSFAMGLIPTMQLHLDCEVIKRVIKRESEGAAFFALDYLPKLPESSRPDVIKTVLSAGWLAERMEVVALNLEMQTRYRRILNMTLLENYWVVQSKLLSSIQEIPAPHQSELYSLQAATLKQALLSPGEGCGSRALSFLPSMPPVHQTDLLKAALRSANKSTCFEAFDFIVKMPAEHQPSLIKAALESRFEEVQLAAFRLIKNQQPAEKQRLYLEFRSSPFFRVRCKAVISCLFAGSSAEEKEAA